MRSDETPVNQLTRKLSRDLGLRGLVLIAFGVVLLAWPGPTLSALLITFGAVAMADGALSIMAAFDAVSPGERWWLVLSGLVAIGIGIGVWAWPDLSALTLLYLIGSWAFATGLIQLGGALWAAFPGRGRLFLALHGLASMTFGVIMWARPGAGALALITLVAALAITAGLALGAMAVELRRAPEHVDAGRGDPRLRPS